ADLVILECARTMVRGGVRATYGEWRGWSSGPSMPGDGSSGMSVSEEIARVAGGEYRYGFSTDLDTEVVDRGLSEEIIAAISTKKGEPDWLLDWRLSSYRQWRTMEEPSWQHVHYEPIDYQDIIYYAAPKPKPGLTSLDEVDPEVRAMFDKLGISLAEQERLSGVAVDAIVDSVSVATTFQAQLAELGVVFCSFSD